MPHTDDSPRFSLKDITIKAGTAQPITLETTGNTEGYIIKTIVFKNPYYTKKLELNLLKERAIPSTGLTFTLPETPSLKPGLYLLSITVGKKEKNNEKQLVQCTITIS